MSLARRKASERANKRAREKLEEGGAPIEWEGTSAAEVLFSLSLSQPSRLK